MSLCGKRRLLWCCGSTGEMAKSISPHLRPLALVLQPGNAFSVSRVGSWLVGCLVGWCAPCCGLETRSIGEVGRAC